MNKSDMNKSEFFKISRDDLFDTLYLIEKILHIIHRAENREDPDNNAYSLAITCFKENIQESVNNLRFQLYSYLSKKDQLHLEEILEDIDRIVIPYDLSLEELRKELEPYLPKYVKLSDVSDE